MCLYKLFICHNEISICPCKLFIDANSRIFESNKTNKDFGEVTEIIKVAPERGFHLSTSNTIADANVNLIQNGMTITQNGMNLTQNGMTLTQNGMTLTQNGMNLTQNGMPLTENGMTLTQNGMTSKTNTKYNEIKYVTKHVNRLRHNIAMESNEVVNIGETCGNKDSLMAGRDGLMTGRDGHITGRDGFTDGRDRLTAGRDSDDNGNYRRAGLASYGGRDTRKCPGDIGALLGAAGRDFQSCPGGASGAGDNGALMGTGGKDYHTRPSGSVCQLSSVVETHRSADNLSRVTDVTDIKKLAKQQEESKFNNFCFCDEL